MGETTTAVTRHRRQAAAAAKPVKLSFCYVLLLCNFSYRASTLADTKVSHIRTREMLPAVVHGTVHMALPRSFFFKYCASNQPGA